MTARARWMTVAGWFLASRLAIAALGVVGVATFASSAGDGTYVVIDNTAALNPETVWHKWDSVWYERIARHGYGYELDTPRGQATAGFFPLYPLTIRLILTLAPSLSFFWVATIFSNVITFTALLLLAGSLIDRDDLAGRAMAIMMTSAGSFYLSIPYTESLFLLLVVGTIVATRRRHYEWAGLLAGLAATTRVHGLPLVAVPALACWLDQTLASRARRARTAATLALFGAPVAVYLAYLAGVQGSWDAFITRQQMWDNPSPYPFQALAGLIEFPRRISGWLHGAFWLLYLGLLARYWRRLPIGEALFCAGVFVISTQQEAFHGVYRYVVPLVPLTLALADDRAGVRHAIIAINLVFGVLMILAFVTNNRLTV
jgi:Gpi18-like mannosyltransferase